MQFLNRNSKKIEEEFTEVVTDMADSSCVVLRFTEGISEEASNWFCKMIVKPVLYGGAGLEVKKYDCNDSEVCNQIFLISASINNLILAAEKFELLKRDQFGKFTPFTVDNRYEFENFEDKNENFFTSSEKQWLINSLLSSVVCNDDKIKNVPGLPKIKVFNDRPLLLQRSMHKIVQIYPLHHIESLKSLENQWYLGWEQPINAIKSYFGESIALYFTFLGFYTKFLLPTAVIGILHYFFIVDENHSENVWFAVLNVVWATVFLELWKRKCSESAFNWGRLSNRIKDDFGYNEKPRPSFKGKLRTSPITGMQELYYPTWKNQMKLYFISYPLLLISLLLVTVGMLFYFHLNEKVQKMYVNQTGIWVILAKRAPKVAYAILVWICSNIYGKVAVILNDWENHRVQSSYNNHLIVKLVFFNFVNSFLSLFYIAFYLCDMAMLRQQLATLLIIQQLIQQVQESFIPYLKYKRQSVKINKNGNCVRFKRIRDTKNQVIKEGNLPPYNSTYNDYVELFLQFGYVFMFSAAYPLAGFWAFLNNIVEIRTDAFKLSKLHQRPFIEQAASIGAWQFAFEVMSIISVITNCGIIALSKSTQDWLMNDLGPLKYTLIFVAIEHMLIILKIFIAYIIPDVPGFVSQQLAQAEFKIQQTLKENQHQFCTLEKQEIIFK
ncbi:anoctamin-10 [Hydra vulgaris]|uniref:Anoctamin n=1 Tax=Hydra vulgaris TaxID=6087 RepID=A0ABM4CJU0_HYDVU